MKTKSARERIPVRRFISQSWPVALQRRRVRHRYPAAFQLQLASRAPVDLAIDGACGRTGFTVQVSRPNLGGGASLRQEQRRVVTAWEGTCK